MYASATATGEMSVRGVATATGWVTATIHYYIAACVWTHGIGLFGAHVTVEFIVQDATGDGTLVFEILHTKRDIYPGQWFIEYVSFL